MFSTRDDNENVDVAAGQRMFEDAQRDVSAILGDEEAPDPLELSSFFEDTIKTQLHVKKLGLVMKDLTIVGELPGARSIPDNLMVLSWLWPPNWISKKKSTFHIVHNITAMAKPGEMLLVLGRPGAGCSSLLRVLANQRKTFADVHGEVNYGGIPAEDFHRYVGESLYIPEEDLHAPTLTLKQTLTFALRNKTPGTRVRDEHKKRAFRNKMFELLTGMFGIRKQANTLVGNEWIRGLSGGERKRLTIAEAMVAQGAVYCWDCPTRGLDAASAYDFVKSLRIVSNTIHKTNVVTMYQVSDAMYNLFDRVLLLDKGRCIYFGPANEAKKYFTTIGYVSEPRKTIPDFLTGLCNPQERKVAPGSEDRVPRTSVEFEEYYHNSEMHKRALSEIDEYEQEVRKDESSRAFVKEVENSKASGAKKRSKYTVGIGTQVHAMVTRHMRLLQGNSFELIFKYTTVILQAIIYGSVFLNLPLTSQGIFLRGGALFGAIFLGFYLSQTEIPAVFSDRQISGKHKSYGMYHTGVLHVAQCVWDMPLLFLQSFFFSIIAYWMYGLDANAGKFFVFLFLTMLTALITAQLYRALGNLSPNMTVCAQLVGVFLVVMCIFIDFILPKNKTGGWVVWLFYINPMYYAFRAFIINELKGLRFDCLAGNAVPYGPGYDNATYRICSIPGATPGQPYIDGDDYLKAVYGIDGSDLTDYALILLAWWIGLTIINILAVEFISWSTGGFTMKVFKKGHAPLVNDETEERELQSKDKSDPDKPFEFKLDGGVFMWNHVNYTVPVNKGTLQLLSDIQGYIKPKQMTALMGSSGAGKTTLLDVLAKRKTLGKVEGEMTLNGQPLRIDFERITGYVEQMDVHNPYLTVREALRFSARLRQEPSVSLEDKYAYVEEVLEMMEMNHLAEALIGDLAQGYGLSVEERKRLTIGMELVAKPYILFLDEPTSGLDSQSAYNIVKFIRKLADAGMPLVCTIHQPSALLFEFFDRILLLARGGKTVYFGDIGPASSTLVDYFESHGGRHFNQSENPAEYILDVIGAGVGKAAETKDWAAVWAESKQKKAIDAELQELTRVASSIPPPKAEAREFATSTWYQLLEVYKRLNLVFWRNPEYNAGRALQGLVVGLLTGFSYWNISHSSSDINLVLFTVLLMMILAINLISATQTQFMLMRDLFKRDYASKYYSTVPFAVSTILVELPYLVVIASVTFFCLYWSTGIDSTAENGFYVWLMVVMVLFYGVSFGQVVASLSPNMLVAFVFLPFSDTFLFLFAGLIIPYPDMPTFWKSWMYHVNPVRYFLEGVFTAVMEPREIVCKAQDLFTFAVPPNSTCGDYMQPFFDAGNKGYVTDTSSTEFCEYCTYKTGADYYEHLTWSADNKWRNFGILTAFWIFNVIMSVIFIYVFRKQRR